MNLLYETMKELKDRGMGIDDIFYCCTDQGWFDRDKFVEIANFEYDNHYGVARINESLIIHTKKGIFYRHEYDGAEWWNFIPNTEPRRIYPTSRDLKQ